MRLKCRAKCMAIKKPTKTNMFLNICFGDILEFSVKLGRVGSSRGMSYAVCITCQNQRTGEVNKNLSFNQIDRVLDNFEFEEIEV